MRLRKLFSFALAAVMLLSAVPAVSASAAATTEDGVVIITDTSSDINRYIYYPVALKSDSKKYPVIVWANGTGCQQGLYADLLKAFAARGYIVVSDDETMAADGKDQISELDYIIKKSKTASHALYGRVNTSKVTAMGHSQGGRSAVNAAAADKRFCCVVSIAGSNYQEEAEKLRAPALFLTGTSDRMVSSSKWVKPAYDICKGAATYASLIDASHTTCCKEPDKYIGYCTSWITAWTNADDKALSVFKAGGALSADPAWTDVVSKNLTNNISGSVTLSAAKYSYDSRVKKPTVTVRDYRGATISSANYTVTYAAGCKNVGKYKVTVKYCNKYSGSKSAYFTIVPKATAITKLTATKGGFKATWTARTAQTKGYQLRYSTSSKFTKATTLTISSPKTASRTVSKLAKGKKYYVRIRAYMTVSGTKYYSTWSSTKSVTTKK